MKVKGDLIEIDKELNELDRFVLDFVNIMNSCEYVIVSGYVSILFGRARGSEDVDLIISPISEERLVKLFEKLEGEGFECINADKNSAFEYLSGKTAIRFARKGTAIPNMEVKFACSFLDNLSIKDRLLVRMGEAELFISPVELQIAYKRMCLKSDKDMEDARHLEVVFEEQLSQEKLNKYAGLIKVHGC